MREWEITPKQFLLVYLLHLHELETASGRPIYQKEHAGKRSIMSSLLEYVEYQRLMGADIQRIVHGLWTSDDVQYLIAKDVLDSSVDAIKPDFESLVLTDKFREDLFALENEFEEFWSLYPAFVTTMKDGKNTRLPLKIVDKDSLEIDYMKKVVTKNQHFRLMKALEWGIDQKLINMRIDRFLKSDYWESLEKEMNKEDEREGPELSETVI